MWRISVITFKHENNIVDNGRHTGHTLPINISQYISIIASILKPSVSNRLLYDEDIKVMIVTSPNSRLDFLVKMGEVLYQLNRWISSLTTAPERGSPSKRMMFFLPAGE